MNSEGDGKSLLEYIEIRSGGLRKGEVFGKIRVF